jgi:hypothetical protein
MTQFKYINIYIYLSCHFSIVIVRQNISSIIIVTQNIAMQRRFMKT